MDGEFGVSRCKLLPFEWISPEVLLYSTGTRSSLLGWSRMDDNLGKGTHVRLGHLRSRGNWPRTENQLCFKKKKKMIVSSRIQCP